ncbi:MAG: 6-phosphogluconolactonase (cycloisomerase 2 family), partial [Gammaproteobacteria bacterium]
MISGRISAFLSMTAPLALAGVLSADTSTRASFAYVANNGDDTISIYSVDPESGRLSFEGFHAAAIGEDGPGTALVHPGGDYLYVTNEDTANISIYVIDSTNGRLAALSPVATGTGPHHSVLSANGDYLYVSAFGADVVRTYSVDAGSGALTPVGAPVSTGAGPEAIALDPLGRFAYVADRTGQDITIFDVDSMTGALSASLAAFVVAPGVPTEMIVDEDGSHAYVSVENLDLVLTYSINAVTGDLSVVNTRPTGDEPARLALRPGGEALWLLNAADEDLIAYTVDTGTGLLTRIPGSFPTGMGRAHLTFDPSGLGAYVSNAGSRDVSGYPVNGITKAPGARATLRARAGAGAIALRPTGALSKQARHLYTLNEGATSISGFSVDETDGSLTSVGADAATGAGPTSLAADPLGRFLYTVDSPIDRLRTYVIDPVTGVLTVSATVITLAGVPQAAAVDPSGRYIFVALDVLDLVVSYSIDQATGLPSVLGTHAIGADVRQIAVDPSGQFVYVTRATGHVEGFRVVDGAATGANFERSAPGDPQGIRFSPSGERAYISLRNNDLVVPFDLNPLNGVPTLVPSGNTTGDQPGGVAIHPTGDFAYAAILDPGGTGTVESFTVNPLDGKLNDLTSTAAGTNPGDLVVDPSGRYLYATNQGSDDVTLFDIDQVTGAPTNNSSSATGVLPTDLALTTTFLTPTPPDCNTNGMPDALDISMGASFDCNANCIPDECETPDCNSNGIPDECDVAFGGSFDCNSNGIPDDCEPDCDNDGTPDDCEVGPDCNANSIPDDCELVGNDCNMNGVPDDCELVANDCNTNGVPDECDPDCDLDGLPDDCEAGPDCNSNGIPDDCELVANDCNSNGIPDDCELVANDCNSNGTPDDCELL